MSVVKQTILAEPRSFKVLPGYVVHMGGGVILESGAVILASLQETLDVIMSQKWKVVEVLAEKPVAVEVKESVAADVEEAHELPEEEPKEVPKAQVNAKFARSRKAR